MDAVIIFGASLSILSLLMLLGYQHSMILALERRVKWLESNRHVEGS